MVHPATVGLAPCTDGTPPWTVGVAYAIGDLVEYNGKIYACKIAHTAVTGWDPASVPALWEEQ